MVLPPHTLPQRVIKAIREYTHAMARELKVIGLMNVQYAVKGDDGLCAGGQPARVAHGAVCQQGHRRSAGQARRQVMAGKTLKQLGLHGGTLARVLGREGIRFPLQPVSRPGHPALAGDAFDGRGHGPGCRPGDRLCQIADGGRRPAAGGRRVFMSVSDAHKAEAAEVGKLFADLGFELIATGGTAAVLEQAGLKVRRIFKCRMPAQRGGPAEEPGNPNRDQHPCRGQRRTRTSSRSGSWPVDTGTPIMTTLSGAKAAAQGIAALRKSGYGVKTLQDIHEVVTTLLGVGCARARAAAAVSPWPRSRGELRIIVGAQCTVEQILRKRMQTPLELRPFSAWPASC